MNREIVWKVVAIIALIFAIAVVSVKKARTHEWYDHECCDTRDCRPVPDATIEEIAPGVLRYKPTGSTFKNEPNFTRIRPSRDNQYHVCITRMNNNGTCIYVRIGS